MPIPEPSRPPWRATVLTLFPDLFPGPLAASVLGEALRTGIWTLDTIDLRRYGHGKHKSVDDTPAGGGAGMVLRADVVSAALAAARQHQAEAEAIYLTPRGELFTQTTAAALARRPGLLLLAGRFEGIDQRVIDASNVREMSIGDYVLAGGELPAMVLIEAVVRLLPGVVGEARSLAEESFANGLLEYPQFTRPRAWQGHAIPEVLLSGDHARIARWRQREAERITQQRRPDLWRRHRGDGEA
jgi:tRNA (guanine37-N1)-methyltransferase